MRVNAYCTGSAEIVYIGKCYATTVRGRWTAPDKDSLWQYLNSRGVERDELTVLVGHPKVVYGRLTKRFQREVESLLICSMPPDGNIANKKGTSQIQEMRSPRNPDPGGKLAGSSGERMLPRQSAIHAIQQF